MAEATVSDKFAQVRGFSVEITSNGAGADVDTAWESVASGVLVIEAPFRTNSPGHKTVGEITLRGAMTASRAALGAWINETVMGKPWKRTVAITPIHLDDVLGETLVFTDCALSAYALPRLTVPDPKAPCPPETATEEVRFTYRDWSVRP